jgi:(1->4)-alpha-D-glucan 1-alpha-D-glucosylmutase
MPGVPDVYQGTEVWDLSLVDPDNRRPVDYELRRTLLARLDGGAAPAVDDAGIAKLQVVAQALRLRGGRPEIFAGTYEPLAATGPYAHHALAFARHDAAVTVATRLPASLDRRGGWRDTSLPLPAGRWTDRLTGAEHAGRVDLGHLLGDLPVALLVRG